MKNAQFRASITSVVINQPMEGGERGDHQPPSPPCILPPPRLIDLAAIRLLLAPEAAPSRSRPPSNLGMRPTRRYLHLLIGFETGSGGAPFRWFPTVLSLARCAQRSSLERGGAAIGKNVRRRSGRPPPFCPSNVISKFIKFPQFEADLFRNQVPRPIGDN